MVRFKKKSSNYTKKNATASFALNAIAYIEQGYDMFNTHCSLNKEELWECVNHFHKAAYYSKKAMEISTDRSRHTPVKMSYKMAQQSEGLSLMAILWDGESSNAKWLEESKEAMFEDTYEKIVGVRPNGKNDCARAMEYAARDIK